MKKLLTLSLLMIVTLSGCLSSGERKHPDENRQSDKASNEKKQHKSGYYYGNIPEIKVIKDKKTFTATVIPKFKQEKEFWIKDVERVDNHIYFAVVTKKEEGCKEKDNLTEIVQYDIQTKKYQSIASFKTWGMSNSFILSGGRLFYKYDSTEIGNGFLEIDQKKVKTLDVPKGYFPDIITSEKIYYQNDFNEKKIEEHDVHTNGLLRKFTTDNATDEYKELVKYTVRSADGKLGLATGDYESKNYEIKNFQTNEIKKVSTPIKKDEGYAGLFSVNFWPDNDHIVEKIKYYVGTDSKVPLTFITSLKTNKSYYAPYIDGAIISERYVSLEGDSGNYLAQFKEDHLRYYKVKGISEIVGNGNKFVTKDGTFVFIGEKGYYFVKP